MKASQSVISALRTLAAPSDASTRAPVSLIKWKGQLVVSAFHRLTQGQTVTEHMAATQNSILAEMVGPAQRSLPVNALRVSMCVCVTCSHVYLVLSCC